MEKTEKVIGYLKRLKTWIRGEDRDEKILAALQSTKEELLNKINDNELAHLRSEIVRYYQKALGNAYISKEEYSYLVTEIFAKYTALGGNSVCAHMMNTIEAYVLKQEDNKND